MVTFAQAQERAEEWINGELPSYQHREVRVREFELGFVVWAEDRSDGPRSDGGDQRLVIARDSGEATLWPSLPVGEVIRRYEEEYGRAGAAAQPAPAAPARVDLNQTSFLLTPPEWLQEAADKLGIPDQRSGSGAGSGAGAEADAGNGNGNGNGSGSGTGGSGAGTGADRSDTSGSGAGSGVGVGSGASAGAGVSGGTAGGAPVAPGASGMPAAPGVPDGATPWAGTDTSVDIGEDRSVPLPETVFAPPLSEDDMTPPDAQTALISGGSQLPPTAVEPALAEPNTPGAMPLPPGGPGG
ncbi:MAG: hypothetical protein HOV84_14950, partial [Streptomyces sp.]|nr:hypothetical protein [Streptomyces sp.]